MPVALGVTVSLNERVDLVMLKLSYEAMVQEISEGGEVEFLYDNVKYAISYKSEVERYFTVFKPQLSVRFSDVEQFLGQVTISGKTIQEIWPHISDLILF